MACSIARTLDVAGEPWSPLVLRDVYVGITRFDDIQRDLGISRKVLSERLKWLVEQGMLERRPYSDRPPRFEYILTEKGLAFCDVLIVMTTWGDRWAAGPDGPPVRHRHRTCGHLARVELRCSECGDPMPAAEVIVEPGPGARRPEQPGL
jgi:DNA-binding HxlR family transcriptional regulator